MTIRDQSEGQRLPSLGESIDATRLRMLAFTTSLKATTGIDASALLRVSTGASALKTVEPQVESAES